MDADQALASGHADFGSVTPRNGQKFDATDLSADSILNQDRQGRMIVAASVLQLADHTLGVGERSGLAVTIDTDMIARRDGAVKDVKVIAGQH